MESHATIDFETRSVADLQAIGAWNYAKDPSTEILCLAYKLPGQYVKVWHPAREFPPLLEKHIRNGNLIEAHNVGFERVIWEFVGLRLHDFPCVDPGQWRCSAALAAMHGLPRKLELACQVMGVWRQKDMVGHRLMMKMCKPRKLTKSEVMAMLGKKKMSKTEVDIARAQLEAIEGPYWHESPADLLRLYLYCGRDVLAECALSEALRHV